jgi:hypothetical protein
MEYHPHRWTIQHSAQVNNLSGLVILASPKRAAAKPLFALTRNGALPGLTLLSAIAGQTAAQLGGIERA